MSAIDPLKKGLDRQRFRTIEPVAPAYKGKPSSPADRTPPAPRCDYRPPDADFYCWKFGVWYNLMDCCYRHARRTFSGCAGCGQGRNNLRANLDRYHDLGIHKDRPFAR
jgi:hypothetical protein